MHIILDLIIIAIVLLVIFISAKKGFVKTFIETLGFVIAIVLAFVISSPVSSFIYDKIVEPSVVKTAEAELADTTAGSTENAVDAVWDDLPGYVTDSGFYNISKDDITDEVINQTAEGNTEASKVISKTLVKPYMTKIISVVVSIVLVVILLIVFKLLAKVISPLFNFSVVGSLNRALGGIFGIFKGLAIAVIFCLLVSLILSFTKEGFLIFKPETINSTIIFKYIMGFSPFL